MSAHQAGRDAPLEKDFSNGGHNNHLDTGTDNDTALQRIRTAGSISISPELFEKIYLSPQNQVKGDLRKTFANPTPLALVGFLLSLTPLSIDLMGWRGAGGDGAAGTATYFFFGGLLMILGSIGEFFLGNTFPFVVFGSFGAFWLGFAGTLQPFFNSYGAYTTNPANPALGLDTPGFQHSFAFFLLWMGFLCLVYFILALRVNVAFAMIFLFLIPAFGCLAASFWVTIGNPTMGKNLLIAGGALAFVVCVIGWYIFAAIMLAALDFPIGLPVGDLSHVFAGASARKEKKGEAIDGAAQV